MRHTCAHFINDPSGPTARIVTNSAHRAPRPTAPRPRVPRFDQQVRGASLLLRDPARFA
jgi:hypothetical protein